MYDPVRSSELFISCRQFCSFHQNLGNPIPYHLDCPDHPLRRFAKQNTVDSSALNSCSILISASNSVLFRFSSSQISPAPTDPKDAKVPRQKILAGLPTYDYAIIETLGNPIVENKDQRRVVFGSWCKTFSGCGWLNEQLSLFMTPRSAIPGAVGSFTTFSNSSGTWLMWSDQRAFLSPRERVLLD